MSCSESVGAPALPSVSRCRSLIDACAARPATSDSQKPSTRAELSRGSNAIVFTTRLPAGRGCMFCRIRSATLAARRITSAGFCRAINSRPLRSTRTSRLSRIARTPALRGCPVSKPASPTLSPGVTSPSSTSSSPGASATSRQTRSRPRTSRYMLEPGSSWRKSHWPPATSTTSSRSRKPGSPASRMPK